MNDIAKPAAQPDFVKASRFRIRHTMLRVRNLEKSVDFYTRLMGMQILRRTDNEAGKFSIVFVGYGDENSNPALELTYNWGVDGYELGDGFGHLALEVDDVFRATEAIRRRGGHILREAGPMNAGTTIIAFVADPDGYAIELIGKKG